MPTYVVRQIYYPRHSEYRLIFFLKKLKLDCCKLRSMHKILFDQKLQEAIAKQRKIQRASEKYAKGASGVRSASNQANDKDLEDIGQLIKYLRSQMQKTFKLNLYLYFVFEGYSEVT